MAPKTSEWELIVIWHGASETDWGKGSLLPPRDTVRREDIWARCFCDELAQWKPRQMPKTRDGRPTRQWVYRHPRWIHRADPK